MDKFRLLKSDEIEVKVKQVSAKGASLLLYKTARTDMDLLDETVGAENWKDDYKEIKGNLYCAISIYDKEKSEWIEKWDCGIESREDDDGNQKKGEASDAFKRAGFRWGIGRELYTSPFIWVSAENMNIEEKEWQGKKKYGSKDTFSVKSIGYDENRRINRLEIVNEKTHKVVYKFGADAPKTNPKEPPKLTCDECNKVVLGYKGRGGREITAKAHIEFTKEKYGKVLCVDCAKKAQAELVAKMEKKDDKSTD